MLNKNDPNLNVHVGGEIVKSHPLDVTTAFRCDKLSSVVVFLARDFHYKQNNLLIESLRDAGINDLKVCLHPSSDLSTYKGTEGVTLWLVGKKYVDVNSSIVFVSSSSVYFDLLKKGIFTVLFKTVQSEFDGLIEVSDSAGVSEVLNTLDEKRGRLSRESIGFLKDATGYLDDNYRQIIDRLS